MTVTAFMLAFYGFAALALSMHRHHRDVFGNPPTRPRSVALRGAGWALLGLALAPCVAHSGWFIGLVLWLGASTASALTVLLLLTVLTSDRRRPPTRRKTSA